MGVLSTPASRHSGNNYSDQPPGTSALTQTFLILETPEYILSGISVLKLSALMKVFGDVLVYRLYRNNMVDSMRKSIHVLQGVPMYDKYREAIEKGLPERCLSALAEFLKVKVK